MFAEAALEMPRPAALRGDASPKRSTSAPPLPTTIFSANSEIYAQGSPADSIYRVEYGTVRIYRLLTDGRRQISAFHVAGEFFGFEADSTHHFFAEAVSRTGVREIPRPMESDLARIVLPLALKALVRAQEHLLVIGRQCATERVAAFLIDMMARQGNGPQIELAMTRADIADYLGLTVETVSRTFSRFKECGHIRLPNARAVYITNVGALRELCA